MERLTNNIRFVIYARVSRDDELDGDSRSIENQKKILKEYINNNNLILSKTYIDDGVSGKTLDRPAFNEMLNDFNKGLFDGIIVKDISRIGRNLYAVTNFIEVYAVENNLRIISVLDHYDSSKKIDDDSIVLKSFVHDYYLREFSKKSRQTFEKRSENNVLANRGLYGYNLIVTNGKSELIINEEEANCVRYIFTEYLKGIMPLELVKYLNDNDFISPGESDYNKMNSSTYQTNNNLSWKTRNICDIIHNLSYSGTYINCKKKGCKVRANAVSIPAIVSKDIQQAAINLAKSRKVKPDEHLSHFIFNTIEGKYFKCKRAYMNYNKRDKVYRLNAARINSKGMSFNPDVLKEIILNETKSVIKELRKNKDYILEKINGTLCENKQMLSNINKKIINIDNARKKLTSNFIIGRISKDEYSINKEKFLEDYNTLIKEMNIIDERMQSLNNKEYDGFVKHILSYKNVDLGLSRIIFKRIDVSLNEKNEKILNFIYNF